MIAEMQNAQLLMVAGFLMLGWVLARRQLALRKRVNRESKVAYRELKKIREHKEPSLPLCDAPQETQRWQVAMFDLQRELKAELDTRIVVTQSLLERIDQRIEHLEQLEGLLEDPGKLSESEAAGQAEPTGQAKPTNRAKPAPNPKPAGGNSPSHLTAAQSARFCSMLRAGNSLEEIAEDLGLSIGDVELLLATHSAAD